MEKVKDASSTCFHKCEPEEGTLIVLNAELALILNPVIKTRKIIVVDSRNGTRFST